MTRTRVLFGRFPLAAVLTAAAAVLCVAPRTQAAGPGATSTRDDFCTAVQLALAGTTLMPKNTIHTDWIAFRESKPGIQPLESQQYVEYEDAARTRPKRISCKTKTWDHLIEFYGDGSARTGGAANCRDMNRDTVLSVWRALAPEERARAKHPPQALMLDGDDNRKTGSAWVEPYEFVYRATDGRIHMLSKALYVPWNEWPWKLAPAAFRGTYYCHLIAPEYARRVMLGEVEITATSSTAAPTAR
jgi:hypothetical protein